MVDEGLGKAFSTLSESPVGAFLVVVCIAFFLTVRALRAELKLERESHQKTRDAQLNDLKGMQKLAEASDAMREELARLRENQWHSRGGR